MLIKISLLKSHSDHSPKKCECTPSKLANLLTTFNVGAKESAQAFVDGHYRGNTRLTSALITKSLIILDIDKYPHDINHLETFLHDELGSYKFIAHSTYSYRPECPSIRIILFLTHEIVAEDYRKLVINFIAILSSTFKDILDWTASSTVNRLFYLPTKSSQDSPSWSLINRGALIDPEQYKADGARELVMASSDPLLQLTNYNPLDNLDDYLIEKYLNAYPATELTHYGDWFKVGCALHHQYKGDKNGLELWNNWSKQDTYIKDNGERRYAGYDDLKKKWHSINSLTPNPVTFASIIYLIKERLKSLAPSVEIPCAIFDPIWPHPKNKKGDKGLPTIENFQYILAHYNIQIKYDIIKKEEVIFINGEQPKDLNIDHLTTKIMSLCAVNQLNITNIDKMVEVTAMSNLFNSWKDWIISEKWDQLDRLPFLYDTVTVEPEYEELKKIYLSKWLMQMIHITCVNEQDLPKMGRMVLTFKGEQGIGKTTWLSSLVQPNMYNYVATGESLDTSKDMSKKTCLEHIFVELGELGSTFRKSDMDALKNFISTREDNLNIKYKVRAAKQRRMTVFFATVNEEEFLQDKTGNTRFLCLPVIKCNPKHDINLQQLYAQLYHIASQYPDRAEDYNLTAEETLMQSKLNKSFQNFSVVEEDFETIYDIDKHTEEDALAKPKALLADGYIHRNKRFIYSSLGYLTANDRSKYRKDLDMVLKKFKYETKPKGWYLPPLRLSNDIDDF